MTTPRRDEFGLIADLFAPLAAGCPGALGLKDDAALIDPPPGRRLVVTTDAMVAGVHFLPDDPPDLIARKLMRVNLSDLAAMGAAPLVVLLAAAFPKDVDGAWLERFAAGLGEDVRAFAVPLAGGDTVATPGPLTLALTAIGHVAPGGELMRSGARAGDHVWVSGTIGDAALGLEALRDPGLGRNEEDRAFLVGRYRLPQPRLSLGLGLAGLASAAMDVSDGLCQDLGHICAASGVGAVVRAAAVPLSAPVRRLLAGTSGMLAKVLGGGDDYELLFTAPPEAAAALARAAEQAGVPITRIGEIVVGEGVSVVDEEGREMALARTGFRHFGGASGG